MTRNTITRKEISALLGVSVKTLMRRSVDSALNLEDFDSGLSRRPVLYLRSNLMKFLAERGLIAE